MKMTISKKTLVVNRILSIIQICIGGFLTFFISFGVSLEFSKVPMDTGFILFCIFLDILSIRRLYYGIKRSRMVSVWKKYAVLVGNAPSVDIKEFSRLTKQSERTVMNHFEWFIEKDFLVDAYIDHKDNEVIFKEAYDKAIMEEKWKLRKKIRIKENDKVAIVCECCGAIAMLPKGSGGLCEYCRAPIGKDKENTDCEDIKYEME